MFLQAERMPRRCDSGLAQQNGTKGGGAMIEVYIDGSSKGNPGPGGAGIVIQDKATQETIGIHGIPLGCVTNNQAEFLALKHALIELKTQRLSHEPVNILTDSQLVVGIFSQNWKARGNLELVMVIRNLLKEFPHVTFAYVRGHNGNQGNELADSLAQEAADS
jgi:ribonuclease HI